MKVLEVLSLFWKSGAVMELLPTGEIKLSNHEAVSPEVMDAAKTVFPQIEKWFKSWVNMTPTQITLWKAYQQYCNWGKNEKILDWLNNDDQAAYLMNDWMIELSKNGWKDIYSDYRSFENENTNEIANQIFRNAVEYQKERKQ